MARKKNPDMTLEFIDADIARSNEILTNLRAEYATLGQAIMAEVDKLKKLGEQRTKFVPVTLESALVCYLETGENEQGYKFLQEISNKGDWKDTGLRFSGSYWSETNQRVLTVWSNNAWDDAKLAVQEAKILEVLPLVKAGILGKESMIQLSKSEEADMNTMKVFEIFDRGLSAHASYKLAALPDGRWIIYDAYSCKYSWGAARKVGTLMDCLKEMRASLYYEGPRDEEDDD